MVDNTDSTERGIRNAILSGMRVSAYLAGTFSLIFSAAPADERKFEVSRKYYRENNADDPRKGFLLTPEEAERYGANFQYCNQERISIDTSTLVEVFSGCGEKPTGPWFATLEDLDGSPVYLSWPDQSGYTEIGHVYTNFNDVNPDRTAEIEVGGFLGMGSKTVPTDLESDAYEIQKLDAGGFAVILRDPTEIGIEDHMR